MVIRTTMSGAFRIFQGREAGSPGFFHGRSWYFEPNTPHGGDGIYSLAYPTLRAAKAAAEDWENEEPDDAEDIR